MSAAYRHNLAPPCAAVQATTALILRNMKGCGIRSTELFKVYDIPNWGRVIRTVFIRELQNCNIPGIAPGDGQLDALADAYADLESDPNGGFILWKAFCDVVESAGYARRGSLERLGPVPGMGEGVFVDPARPSPPPAVDVNLHLTAAEKAGALAAMLVVKAAVGRRRLDASLPDAFCVFDPLREGVVTVDRAARVLGTAGVEMGPADMVALARYYRKGDSGHLATLFGYRGFIEDLNLAPPRTSA